MTEVRVKAWMSGDPVTVGPECTAGEALELMMRRGIRHLPVIDEQRRVVGVLSFDDLRAALPFPLRADRAPTAEERSAARGKRVGDIMSTSPLTLSGEASLEEAAERMADARIGCLPVVESGQLVGLLSETDALRALATTLWSRRHGSGRHPLDEPPEGGAE